MNTNTKFLISVTLLILFLMPVFAIEVTDVSQPSNPTTITSAQSSAQILAKITALEGKVNSLPTKEELTSDLTAHLKIVDEIMNNFRSLMIVSFIIIGGALLGLAFSIYFYFKGQGRL